MAEDSFQRLVAMLDYTMFVVTAAAGGHASGCLVGFATQISLSPARFLVGMSKGNHTFGVAAQSDYLAVHVLAQGDHELAALFGSRTGEQIDKFDHCAWHRGPAGMPILDDAPAWFVGKTLDRIDLGDHVGYLLEPVAGHAEQSAGALLAFSEVGDIEPGHPA